MSAGSGDQTKCLFRSGSFKNFSFCTFSNIFDPFSDTNECEQGLHNCQPDFLGWQCINQVSGLNCLNFRLLVPLQTRNTAYPVGRFKCDCKDGFELAGESCKDKNECSSQPCGRVFAIKSTLCLNLVHPYL